MPSPMRTPRLNPLLLGLSWHSTTLHTDSAGTQPTKPHAVRQAGTSSFGYDCNGNMSARVVANTGYSLFYNAENRLETVEQVPGGGVEAAYVYEGDGRRVQATTNGETTHYPGPHFERTLSSGYTKYYSFGGELVAFERSPGYPANTGRRFVLRDHLNSTAVIVNGGGTRLWEERYLPFGELRQTWKSASEMPVQTPYRYTGQRLEVGVGAPSPVDGLDRGLYDYGARWYDPMLGRFAQPDSIVPEPGNPQSLNRYAYVLNNPLKYTDPMGHAECIDARCELVAHPITGRTILHGGTPAIIRYIQGEMQHNLVSTNGLRIKAANELTQYGGWKAVMGKFAAYGIWASQVMDASVRNYLPASVAERVARWDHKPILLNPAHSPVPEMRANGGWSTIGSNQYRFDTWSNIHYGFVGAGTGFSKTELLAGGGLEQIGSDSLSALKQGASVLEKNGTWEELVAQAIPYLPHRSGQSNNWAISWDRSCRYSEVGPIVKTTDR